jgi:outer membrane lipoprotein SlyB
VGKEVTAWNSPPASNFRRGKTYYYLGKGREHTEVTTMKFFWGITAVLLTVVTAGCTPKSMSGDVYSRERAQKVQTVEYGEVVEVRQVLIEGTKSGLGALGGGALGGALGSGVGRGAGTTIAVVGGAIAGAVAGSVVEEGATKQPGVEVTVRMDAGSTISLVQGVDPPVRAGDRVRILRNPDGSARAIPLATGGTPGAPAAQPPR